MILKDRVIYFYFFINDFFDYRVILFRSRAISYLCQACEETHLGVPHPKLLLFVSGPKTNALALWIEAVATGVVGVSLFFLRFFLVFVSFS